jgi:hypothetical protein
VSIPDDPAPFNLPNKRKRLLTGSCDVLKSDVNVSGNRVVCGKVVYPSAETLFVVGKSTEFVVFVQSSSLTVVLSEVTVEGVSPFSASESSVAVVLEGQNAFVNRESLSFSAAFECLDSNLTVSSTSAGSLVGDGGESGPGIGLGVSGMCNSVLFVNASISASGTTGVGTGAAPSGDSICIQKLIVEDSNLSLNGLSSGPGMGSGSGVNGHGWDWSPKGLIGLGSF